MNSTSVALADVSLSRRSLPPTPIAAPSSWPVAILGVPFDAVSSADALEQIEAMIASRKPHYVVTANVDFLVQAQRDVELRRILIDADLVLCDGTPLLWASRWLGNRLPERVAGSDLAPRLLRLAAEHGHRVFFLGAAPGVAAAAAAELQRQYPTLQVAGHYSPPTSALLDMDHASILERVRTSSADILLVAFGCPKQEKWIAMHYRALGVPVCIGVGATLDFLAGRVKRAPAWMRQSGGEWLYRLWQEPRRLYRRYALDAWSFVPALAKQWWRTTGGHRLADAPPRLVESAPTWQLIEAGSSLTRSALERHAAFWRRVLTSGTESAVDLGRVKRIDAAGIAFLVKWRKALQPQSRRLVLAGPAPVVRDALERHRLADFFVFAPTATEARRAAATRCVTLVSCDDAARALAWAGEITAANVEAAWHQTREAVQRYADGGAAVVPIDLGGLHFIDSSAAGLMIRLKQWARTLPMEILFAHAPPNVHNVLRLVRLDHLLLDGAQ